jgi:KipI family sensor histidine kinase inhibitor
MESPYPLIKPAGDAAVLIEFEPEVSPRINTKVHQMAYGLGQMQLNGLFEAVPAYRSLIVYYDPFALSFSQLSDIIMDFSKKFQEVRMPPPKRFVFPTVYGGEFGPDLSRVAAHTRLEPEEIISRYCELTLSVYCLGFTCSLAYLGKVPEALYTPRLDTPRKEMPAGSVGMTGPQANILPIDTPSGLNYIGRTFVSVYDPTRFPPTLISPGDQIRCPAVSESEARHAAQKPLEAFLVDPAD